MKNRFLPLALMLLLGFNNCYGQTVDYFRDLMFMEGPGEAVHEFYYFHSPLLYNYSEKPHGALKVLAIFPEGLPHNRMRNNIEIDIVFDLYLESLDIVQNEKEFREQVQKKKYDAFILPIEDYRQLRLHYSFDPEEIFVYSQDKSIYEIPLLENGLRVGNRFNRHLDKIHLPLKLLWEYKYQRSNLGEWKSKQAEFFVGSFFNVYFILTLLALFSFPMLGFYFRFKKNVKVLLLAVLVPLLVAIVLFFMFLNPVWGYFQEAQNLRYSSNNDLKPIWKMAEKQTVYSRILVLRTLTEKSKDDKRGLFYKTNKEKIDAIVKDSVDHRDQRVRMFAYTLLSYCDNPSLFFELLNNERLKDASFMVRSRQIRCLQMFNYEDAEMPKVLHVLKSMYLYETHPFVLGQIRDALFKLSLLKDSFLVETPEGEVFP